MLPWRQLRWHASADRPPRFWKCAGLAFARQLSSIATTNFPTLAQTSSLQVYRSLSKDPFVNLTIENFLFVHAPQDSKILFLYTNRPCVIIGRNQNPWLETNLRLLSQKAQNSVEDGSPNHAFLVRRRSGGGAVFHDEGNLNYSVICPKAIFDRDKHAEMVVRALKSIGAVNTRVNERHDIVMGENSKEPTADVIKVGSSDVESPRVEMTPRALKISGSAYKLSRARALHHGTCLIDSPNLAELGAFLRSPARPYLHARGVDSVRSPVGNVSSVVPGVRRTELMRMLSAQIMEEFAKLYGVDDEGLMRAQTACTDQAELYTDGNWTVGTVDDGVLSGHPGMQEDLKTLQSLEWKYNVSPQFTFSNYPTEEDPRPRPPIPPEVLSPSTRVFFRFKHGEIVEGRISTSPDPSVAQSQEMRVNSVLAGRVLHEITDWKELLDASQALGPDEEVARLARWLDEKLGH
ncbi:hypothetical protein VTO42DRAFT_2739 [Malbranchea cinnamomea]